MNFLNEKQGGKRKKSIDLRLKVIHKKNSTIPVHTCVKNRDFLLSRKIKRQRLENILLLIIYLILKVHLLKLGTVKQRRA